jgi:meso-butanediol dehydrogenase/(S,S)-butanediol dehydrogenase/diacetyl reductase
MQRFINKVAFITGAASGIGRETAVRFAQEGAKVMLCDIDEVGLQATALDCQRDDCNALTQVCDVSDYDACASAVNPCIEQYGQLDILCNIAGIARLEHFTDISVEAWQKMLGINLSGVFYLCQLTMPHLIKTKGNIVNMASSAGLSGSG